MSINYNPTIVQSGLIMHYDMNNVKKSFLGATTTNLSAGISLSNYNNTPSDVTTTISSTSETYQGATVWKQILTPTTTAGVGYLTAGGNPGLGVVTGGGGGTGGVYTGHSIFFKPASATYSTPVFTQYSNISGWQSTGNYDVMGDGWYRANVIFYNAATLSDGKYWAFNPAGALLNTPITVYWAGTFKESQNYSTFVSPYTNTSRASTGVVVDLTGGTTWTANNLTYNTVGSFSFNGSSSWLESPTSSIYDLQAFTMECWCNPADIAQNGFLFEKGQVNTQYSNFFNGGSFIFRTIGLSTQDLTFTVSSYITVNTWNHIVCTYGGGTKTIYVNGVQVAQATGLTGNLPTGQTNQYIGKYGSAGNNYPFNGQIGVSRVYNRVLSSAEVVQNFTAHRGRYGR